MIDTQRSKQLIKKVKQGDTDAFRLLVENYQHLAFTVAFNIIKNKQDAEEVVQDSFVKVFSKISQFKEEAKFSSWLFKIVYNTALSRIRKKKLDVYTLEPEEYGVEHGVSLHSGWDYLVLKDQQKYIQKAMDNLSEQDKLVLTLFYLADEGLNEICKITDEKKTTVKARLHRARAKMYTQLNNLLKDEITVLI
ncbi:MAG: sigma-70 family RNA polymerase sigma factor [Cyclobacteriaceae bacterium]|nr:sigma-70 family RNA polymerase sigma factor [Cyclobacteriaceae bacterium]